MESGHGTQERSFWLWSIDRGGNEPTYLTDQIGSNPDTEGVKVIIPV